MAVGGADVNLGIDIEKKGQGDKEAAAGLELVARAADNAADELKQLDRKLLETRAALLAAGKDFTKTGDASPFKQLLKDERQLQQVHKTLSRLTQDSKKDLEGLGQVVEKGFFKSITTGITTGVEDGLAAAGNAIKSHPVIAGAVAGGILLGLPVIAGALEATVAAGGIAAGIVLAAKNPATAAAWSQVGEVAKRQLTEAANPFVPVLVHGAQTVQEMFDKIMPEIRADFAVLAPVADRLFTGAAGFVQELMPGIDALVHQGGPVLDMLSRELPRLGASISTAFSSIASAGQGGKEALQDMLRMAEGSIVVFGKLTEITERVYLAERAIVQDFAAAFSNRDFSGAIDSMAGALTTTKNANVGLSDAIQGTIKATREAASSGTVAAGVFRDEQAAAAALSNEISRITNASLGLAGADLQLRSDEAGLVALHKEHGSALQGNTAQALANQHAFLGLAQDLEAVRQKEIQHGATLEEANAHLQANEGHLLDMAAAAGYDRGQVQTLIESMLAIPDVHRTIQIDEIRTHTDIYRTIDQTGNIVGGSPYQRSASQIGFGLGGIIAGARGFIANGPTFLIGERTVPEVAIPAPNSGISERRADMLLNTAASYWGRRIVSKDDKNNSRPMVLSPTINIYGATDPRAVADAVDDRLRQLGRDADFLARTRG